MKFVFDTNILVSAVLIGSSKPDYAYKKAKSLGSILFSQTTFQELDEIIKRPKFDKYVLPKTRAEFMAKLKLESEFINITETIAFSLIKLIILTLILLRVIATANNDRTREKRRTKREN